MALLRNTLVPVKSQHLPLLCWLLMPLLLTSTLKWVSFAWRLSWFNAMDCMLTLLMALCSALSVGVGL